MKRGGKSRLALHRESPSFGITPVSEQMVITVKVWCGIRTFPRWLFGCGGLRVMPPAGCGVIYYTDFLTVVPSALCPHRPPHINIGHHPWIPSGLPQRAPCVAHMSEGSACFNHGHVLPPVPRWGKKPVSARPLESTTQPFRLLSCDTACAFHAATEPARSPAGTQTRSLAS